MTTKKWQGRDVATARAHWAARLRTNPLPCHQCGKPVMPNQRWVVEHITPRSHGGHPTDVTNQWVSHRTCSDRSGGRMGMAILNARRAQPQRETARDRGIRGI